MIDPIIEEIHKMREEYAAKFDFNIDEMFKDLREKQSQSNREIVSFVKVKKNKLITDEKKVA
ncbi:hypothetical protein BH20ACI4_BH20ACI4_06420 [soil metagenome]